MQERTAKNIPETEAAKLQADETSRAAHNEAADTVNGALSNEVLEQVAAGHERSRPVDVFI